MSSVSPALRSRVRRRARGLCEYCRCSEELTGHDFTVDHILPEARGGKTRAPNLCWCCFWCNNFKHARTEVPDPRTGQRVPLFNPRSDVWDDHFQWDARGTSNCEGVASESHHSGCCPTRLGAAQPASPRVAASVVCVRMRAARNVWVGRTTPPDIQQEELHRRYPVPFAKLPIGSSRTPPYHGVRHDENAAPPPSGARLRPGA